MPTLNLGEIESTSAPVSLREWSPQQQAVFAAVEDLRAGSLEVIAVAGAGKTTTLVEAASRMKGRIAFCAFNRRIADEIKAKVRGLPSVTCGTLHSFGLRAWMETAPNALVDGDKLRNLASEDLRVPYWAANFTVFMVSMAKQHGYKCPVEYAEWQVIADHFDATDKLGEGWDTDPDRDPFEFCNPLLRASIESSQDVIDFDDMLYMPLCYGTIRAEYDWILVDEAQDTNRVRRLLVEAMLNPGGRVCVVGDPHQAIYGFTGADADAMDLLKSTFGCESLPLTITYRCPKKIVAHANQWVSHIQAAPSAPEGVLRELTAREFEELSAEAFTPKDVVLCRNTRPLIDLALSLLRRGIGCRVEGRDIGAQLQAVVNKWKIVRDLNALREHLDVWQERETRKLRSRGQAQKAAMVEDKVASLFALMSSLRRPNDTLQGLRSQITALFGDTEPGKEPRLCTLSTIHKAKGREWDRVYLLGRKELMPSKWARQEWELEQERNLCYVAVTRAKRELVEVEYVG